MTEFIPGTLAERYDTVIDVAKTTYMDEEECYDYMRNKYVLPAFHLSPIGDLETRISNLAYRARSNRSTRNTCLGFTALGLGLAAIAFFGNYNTKPLALAAIAPAAFAAVAAADQHRTARLRQEASRFYELLLESKTRD